jgi:hypothetical protein
MHQKLTLAFACACALVVSLGAATIRADSTPEPTTTTETDTGPPQFDQREIQRQIDKYRHEVWRWQRTMGNPVTRQLPNAPADANAKVATWQQVASKLRRRAQNPPHKEAWLCIYRYERNPRQGWRTNTGNGYYGGLQMDIGFQRTYAPRLVQTKGTADRWTALEQIWAAERARRSGRGFYPWPRTARACALIP